MRTKQLFGLIGSIVLSLECLRLMRNMKYLQNGKDDGTIVLSLALISLVLVWAKKYKRFWVTGCAGKVGILLCIPLLLTGCNVVTLSELESQTPAQRANTVCVYQSDYAQAKSKYNAANKQHITWKTDAGNGYKTKSECEIIQEPYSEQELRCKDYINSSRTEWTECDTVTVTKHRSVSRCRDVYIPINAQAAYAQANIWKRNAEEHKATMHSAWNNCHSWAMKSSPKQLYDWLNKCKVLDKDISMTYSGGCKNGLAHGEGVAKGRDVYRGSFAKGNNHGFGIYVWGSNSEWAGNRYEGEFYNGNRTGYGIYSSPRKNVHDWETFKNYGIFENGRYYIRGIFLNNAVTHICSSKNDCKQI